MDVDVEVEGMEGIIKESDAVIPGAFAFCLCTPACMLITWSYPSLFPAFCPFTNPITMCLS
jgi:hypothetical protein